MLDFMIHGKVKYLWEDNGVNATKAWKIISDFKDAVKKTAVALKIYCPPDDIDIGRAQGIALLLCCDVALWLRT